MSWTGMCSVMQIDRPDPGVDRLVDGVGREAGRDEDERRVGARFRDRVGDRAEDGDALDVLASLARRDPGDDVRPVGAVAQPVEAALAAGQALDDEARLAVDEDRHQAGRARRMIRSSLKKPPSMRSASSSRTRSASAPVQPVRSSQGSSSTGWSKICDLLDDQPCAFEEAAPLGLAVVADVRGVAELLGLLELLAVVERVDDDDPLRCDPAELARRLRRIGEVVRGDPRDREVEGPVGERQLLGEADHVRLHPRRRVAAHDLEPGLAQPPRHMPAAGRDVDRRLAALGPLDDQVEIRPLGVRRARPVQLRPLAPRITHAISPSNWFRHASCGELHGAAGCLEHRRLDARGPRGRPRPGCGGPPRRSCRRGGRRSGRSGRSRRGRSRMPRATSSQRVIPPKMLKRIERTCVSRAITSSAATTPAAEPPPPRSQKFAGRPPATTTTSTVDIESPAPFPRIPTEPSSFT